MAKIVIRHITKVHHIPSIIEDWEIQLEGSNFLSNTYHTDKEKLMWRNRQTRHMGRWVWFTEEQTCNVILYPANNPTRLLPFEFFAEDIKAMKWSNVRNAYLNSKNSKRGREYVRGMEEIAIERGDDISKWWVRDKPVSLQYWLKDEKIFEELGYKK